MRKILWIHSGPYSGPGDKCSAGSYWTAKLPTIKEVKFHYFPCVTITNPWYTVLDLGCGCGAQGIAALKSGAKIPVTFNDIDTNALNAVTLNNHANNVDAIKAVKLDGNNYIAHDNDQDVQK